MTVRKFAPGDEREVRRLARKLAGPAADLDYWEAQLFVHDPGSGQLGGFIAITRRPWSEATSSGPVAHVGAWYVERRLRRKGIGARLMRAAEHWARLNGFHEICSDAEADDPAGLAAHQRLGFEPARRLQFFRKRLAQAAILARGQG